MHCDALRAMRGRADIRVHLRDTRTVSRVEALEPAGALIFGLRKASMAVWRGPWRRHLRRGARAWVTSGATGRRTAMESRCRRGRGCCDGCGCLFPVGSADEEPYPEANQRNSSHSSDDPAYDRANVRTGAWSCGRGCWTWRRTRGRSCCRAWLRRKAGGDRCVCCGKEDRSVSSCYSAIPEGVPFGILVIVLETMRKI